MESQAKGNSRAKAQRSRLGGEGEEGGMYKKKDGYNKSRRVGMSQIMKKPVCQN